MSKPDAIDEYLDTLFAQLAKRGRNGRRLLNEAEAHLRDSAEASIANGMSPDEAQQEAVARFGKASTVANSAAPSPSHQTIVAITAESVAVLWKLAAIALLVIAASAIIDLVFSSLASTSFVFGSPPGTTYKASACAHWLSVQPQTHTCASAHLTESRDDAIAQRVAAGILGLLLIVVSVFARRRFHNPHLLPSTFTATIGATGFASTALVLIAFAVDKISVGESAGAGQWLALGLSSAIVAIGFLVSLTRAFIQQAAT